MNDRQLEAVLAYLNENSGRYSLEALRRQLLQTGYDPATVDRAVATFQGETFQGEVPPSEGPGVGHYGVLVLLVLLAMLINSGLAAKATTAYLATRDHPSDSSHLHFATRLFLVEAIGAFVLLFTRRFRKLGCWILGSLVLAIVVGMVSFVGYCMMNM